MFSDEMVSLMATDGSTIGYAVEIEFDDNAVTRAHTGTGNVLINGQIFYGVGELGGVGPVQSIGDSNPNRLTISLEGIPSHVFTEAMKAKARGRPAKLYALVFNEKIQLQKAEAILVGFVVDYQVSIGSTGSVSMDIADEFELYEMPWHEYWTDSSHTMSRAGDKICRYVAQMEEREIQWGSSGDAPPLRYEK